MSLTTLDGRYHVTYRIASGGMGEVFRAHDVVLDREVAIKVLHRTLAGDPGFIERFRREARAAAGLNHPNIVAVYDWGATDGIYFMVMEHVRGESVRDLLNASGRLEPSQAVDVLLQVLSALEHAHRKGIVHRDVKPENVIVTREGVAKVADFGLARAYADARVTQVGTVTGTVQYLAPEQIRGEPADPRTDLYSLGVVGYELLTGTVPFSGETSLAIAYKHLSDRVPPPSAKVPGLPHALDGWVSSMTEKDRELRPESATEARRDLQAETATLAPAPALAELVADAAIVVPEPTDDEAPITTVTIPRATSKRERRARRRRRGAWILLALVALSGAAWGAWTYLVPHYANVPQVTGLPTKEAQARLESAGFVVKIAPKGDYSDRYAVGEVIRTQPAAGARLEQGSRVVLVLSLGREPVPVPDLTGLTLDQAEKALKRADLQLGQVVRGYSEESERGQIFEQSFTSEEEAPKGTAIDVTVSKGPRPVPVPDVVGDPRAKAESELEGAGFVVDIQEDFSDEVNEGRVISQDPEAETRLQPGETVAIVVSKGPETFAMPNVLGMSEDAATALLHGKGLIVDVIQLPGFNGHTVQLQQPEPGTTVHVGDTVHIYVG